MLWKTGSSPKQLLAAVFTLGYLQQTELVYTIMFPDRTLLVVKRMTPATARKAGISYYTTVWKYGLF
jgi:hypothetical protein